MRRGRIGEDRRRRRRAGAGGDATLPPLPLRPKCRRRNAAPPRGPPAARTAVGTLRPAVRLPERPHTAAGTNDHSRPPSLSDSHTLPPSLARLLVGRGRRASWSVRCGGGEGDAGRGSGPARLGSAQPGPGTTSGT